MYNRPKLKVTLITENSMDEVVKALSAIKYVEIKIESAPLMQLVQEG